MANDFRKLLILSSNFHRKALDKTAKGKHSSGDTAWEESTLKKYRYSELRLVDIEKQLCKDADKHEYHCRSFYGEVDLEVEEWFSNHQEIEPSLHKWLCIDKQKVCCPPNHYGKWLCAAVYTDI